MKKLKDFGLFLESKEVISSDVEKEVKKIISEMFAVGKNICFSGDQNGESEYVDFEVNSNDFNLDYEEAFFMEYSENILKKRMFKVSLIFDSKSIEGSKENSIYKIKFRIELIHTSDMIFDKNKSKLGWSFEEVPIKTINFIKKGHQKFDWNESKYILSIEKDDYDKLATDQLRVIIRKEGGEKVRVK